jgi:hypothetical protein
MTSRRTWIAALALAAALGGCEKRKAPAAEAPPEPAPAETATPLAEAPPAAAIDAQPSAAAEPQAATGEPGDEETEVEKTGVEAGPSGRTGRKCGGVAGFRCEDGEKCRYARSTFTPPHPDAMGACVAETYCDAPTDCEGLMHVMVVGKWACPKHRCAWKADPGAPQ